MMGRSHRAVFLLSAAATLGSVVGFSDGQELTVLATHVGPVNNPSETYPYYVLPFCPTKDGSTALPSQDFADSLAGDRKVKTAFTLHFKKNENLQACEMTLGENDLDRFSTAIEEEWYGELFIDDMPMWVYIGEGESEDFLLGHTDKSKHFLYTHLHFVLGYNGDKVVSANVTASPDNKADITSHDPTHAGLPSLGESHGSPGSSSHSHGGGKPITVKFSYSVEWVPSSVKPEERMDVYSQHTFMPAALEIHWLSIINSLVLVMLLTAFLAIILMRVIKNDFTRYMRAEDDEEAAEEETGWKLIHGDVFRVPANLSLFASFVGAGMHLFVMLIILLTMAVAGTFSLARRGSIVAACIILYVLVAFVGGYMSGRLYKQLRGSTWVWNVMLNLAVVPVPLIATFTVLNSTAVAKSSAAALPFSTIFAVVMLFLLVAFPLTVLGGIAGHNSREFEPPCRTSKVPRQIPDVPFYRSAPAQLFMAGFLPFSAISIELHYIFASVWGHKVYTLYGILFLAFGLLTVVTSFIVIALTYFQLAAEDHRWWWRSFLSGGMVGVFIYAYCFFYYFNHSGMSGLLQTAFYFLYMANVAFAFFLMMGSIGFYSAFAFVRYIYSSIKTD